MAKVADLLGPPPAATALSSGGRRVSDFLGQREPEMRAPDLWGSLASDAVDWGGRALRGLADTATAASELAIEGPLRTAEAISGRELPRDRLMPMLEDVVGDTSPIPPQESWFYQAGDWLSRQAEEIGPPRDQRTLAEDIAGGLGQIGPQALAYLVNPTLAAGLMFGQGADIQARRADDAGVTDPQTRAAAILGGGAITAGTEWLPIERLFGPGADVVKNRLVNWLADAGIAGSVEAAQELVEGALQDVLTMSTTDPDHPFLQDIGREMAAAGGAAGIFRAMLTAVFPGMRRRPQEQEDQPAAAQQPAQPAQPAMMPDLAQPDPVVGAASVGQALGQTEMAQILSALAAGGNVDPAGGTGTIDPRLMPRLGTLARQVAPGTVEPTATMQRRQMVQRPTPITVSIEDYLEQRPAPYTPLQHQVPIGTPEEKADILRRVRRMARQRGVPAIIGGTAEQPFITSPNATLAGDRLLTEILADEVERFARRRTQSLAQWIADRGGIVDEGGDLRAMGAHEWHRTQRPGTRRLLTDDPGVDGRNTPDMVREAAIEAGYLKPDADINDLLNAIAEDIRTGQVMPPDDMDVLAAAAQVRNETREQRLARRQEEEPEWFAAWQRALDLGLNPDVDWDLEDLHIGIGEREAIQAEAEVDADVAEEQEHDDIPFDIPPAGPAADGGRAQGEADAWPGPRAGVAGAPEDAGPVAEGRGDTGPRDPEAAQGERPSAAGAQDPREEGGRDEGLADSKAHRRLGIPAGIPKIATARSRMKDHPDYEAAKGGDLEAAGRLVTDLIPDDTLAEIGQRFGSDVTFVAVNALEAGGFNAIPQMMVERLAAGTGASSTDSIVQTAKAHHTGASAVERIMARALFDGPVEPGRRYVLVDDVATLASTLAELSNHIRLGGGDVAGIVLLVDATRTNDLQPTANQLQRIEEKGLGEVLRTELNIEPSALTRPEAGNVGKFGSADTFRAAIAAAKGARGERLRPEAVRPEADRVAPPAGDTGETTPEPAASQPPVGEAGQPATQDRSEPEAAPAASAALRQRIEAIEQDIAEAQADLDRLMAERRAVNTQAETAAALLEPAIQTPRYYTERGRQIGEWEYPIDAEWSIIGGLPTYRVEREKGEKTWKVYEVTTVDGGTARQRNERRLIAGDLTRRAAEALARERLEANYRAAAPAPVRRRQQLGEEIARINARIAELEAEVEALMPDLERAAEAEMDAERAVTMSAEAVMPQDGFTLTAPEGPKPKEPDAEVGLPLNLPPAKDPGRLRGKGEQQATDEGLFAPPEDDGQTDIEDAVKRAAKKEAPALKIGTGDILRSDSGRELSPAPKIDATSDRRALNSIKRMDAWLQGEAVRELRSQGNDFGADMIARLDPNKFSQSDRDLVNETLWPDTGYATEAHLISRGGKPPAVTERERLLLQIIGWTDQDIANATPAMRRDNIDSALAEARRHVQLVDEPLLDVGPDTPMHYIATGEKGAMFTLRQLRRDKSGLHDSYIMNLARDRETAVDKARLVVHRAGGYRLYTAGLGIDLAAIDRGAGGSGSGKAPLADQSDVPENEPRPQQDLSDAEVIAQAGLSLEEKVSKRGRTYWAASGALADHKAVLDALGFGDLWRMGGKWFRSVHKGDPTQALAAALRGKPVANSPQEEAPLPDITDEAADKALRGAKLEVVKESDGYVVRGQGTFDHKDTIKDLGGRWDGSARAWRFADDPTKRLAAAIADKNAGAPGDAGDDAGPERDPAEEQRLRELRQREDGRPDEREGGVDVGRYVSEETRRLISAGRDFGIPEDVIRDQIEDVAFINRAYQSGKPMFVLANEAGTGKTFVLGGAIRELRRAGASRFVYVTMNVDLIEQIRRDLKAYGVDDVEFHTYAGLSGKAAPDTTGAVLIFDEAHNVKNVGAGTARAEKAQELIGRARFSIFASATPFENPVQARYLAATQIFEPAGGFDDWAKAYGAAVRRRKYWNPHTRRQEVEEIIYWVGGKAKRADGAAARAWFFKQGVMTQRPMKIDPKMVDVTFRKTQVADSWREIYDRVTAAYDDATSRWTADDGTPVNPKIFSEIARHRENTIKRILEAAKVDYAIERAKVHLSAGKNVVIFVETKADRELGLWRRSEHFKDSTLYTYPQMARMMADWEMEAEAAYRMRERPPPRPFAEFIVEIAAAFDRHQIRYDLPSTADDIMAALGGESAVAIYTGAVSNTKASRNKQDFLAGKKRVLIATMAKGGTGLSLHDTTGNRPTVQVNINLPWVATGVDQVSGRVARYGLKSKAQIEWLFAGNIPWESQKLAPRVGARMRDMGALVKGIDVKAAAALEGDFDFESEIDVKQAAGEGLIDVAAADAEDRQDIYARAERLEGSRQRATDTSGGFFETPYPLAALMQRISGVRAGDRVLEPSAGTGNLLAFMPDDVQITAVELRPDNFRQLKGRMSRRSGAELHNGDFLEWASSAGEFDVIVMNPPFERVKGIGAQDAAHVRAAYDHLAPGGRLVAIMGEGVFFREQDADFRGWLDDVGATVIRLPKKAFQKSGTGVNARMVVIDKGGPDWSGRSDLDLHDMDTASLRAIEATVPARAAVARAGASEDGGRLRQGPGHLEPSEHRPAPFFSAALKAARALPQAKGAGNQFLAQLRKAPGVKPEELDWVGITDFLSGRRSVTRDELVAFIEQNQVRVEEVVKGEPTLRQAWGIIEDYVAGAWDPDYGRDDYMDEHGLETDEDVIAHAQEAFGLPDATKFDSYTLPGGQNYRELLLTLPGGADRFTVDGDEVLGPEDVAGERDVYHSPHWDELNVLAHVRFNERTDTQGRRTLFIEEIQSDWHQAGRKKGYRGRSIEEIDRDMDFAVPDAPLKKTWHETAFRRMVRYAAENGFDAVAWTPGEVQAERYDLSKQVDGVRVMGSPAADVVHVMVKRAGARDYERLAGETSSVPRDRLADTVGKELAEKALAELDAGQLSVTFEGVDLKVGGEGMKGFYDRILPAYAAKFGKRFGAAVGKTEISTDDGGIEVWALPITPEMREVALGEGFALFNRASQGEPLWGGLTLEEAWAAIEREYGRAFSPEQRREFMADFGLRDDAEVIAFAEIGQDAEGLRRRIEQAVVAEVERIGIPGVRVRAVLKSNLSTVPGKLVTGRYDPLQNLIEIALQPIGEAVRVGRHEIGHLLVDAGVITDREWGVLMRRAQSKWMKDPKLDIAGRYKHLDRAGQLEEAFVEALSHFRLDPTSEHGIVRAILTKIARFLEAVGNAIRGLGFQTADEVLARIERGEMRQRAAAMRGGQARESVDTSSAAFKRWFGNSKVVDENGEPLVVYHGTRGGDIEAFTGHEIYFSDSHAEANRFASKWQQEDIHDAGAIVYPAYLSFQNPHIVDARGEVFDPWSMDEWIAEARAAGHDGLIVRNIQNFEFGDLSTTYVAFRPEQIKSVFNRGTWNPADPRIREHAAAVPAEPDLLGRATSLGAGTARADRGTASFLDEFNLAITDEVIGKGKWTKRADHLRTIMQDKLLPLKRAQQVVEKQIGRKLRDSENAYQATETYSGRAGDKLDRLDREIIKPLLETIARNGLDLASVDRWLTARHAHERNARIASINPNFEEGTGSGMTDAEADAVIAEVEASDKRDAYEQVAEYVRQLRELDLDNRVEMGLMTADAAVGLRAMYQNYVPLKGLEFDPFEDDGGFLSGRGFDTRGPEFRRAFGRRSKAPDVLLNMIKQVQEGIIRGEKNRVGLALYNLVRNNPDPTYWEVNATRQVPDIDKETGLVVYRRQPLRDPAKQIEVKIDGKSHVITLHDPRLAAAIKNLDVDKGNAVLRAGMAINRFLSAINTRYNPEFVISNAFRDLQTASVNLTQHEVDGLVWQTIKDWPKALRAAYGGIRGKEVDGEWARYYREFAAAGGKVAFLRFDDLDALRRRTEKEIKAITATSPAAQVKRAFRAGMKLVEESSDAVENAVRLSAFVQLRRAGMSRDKAASAAKNLTVNFNRHGSGGPTLNALYLFYNASVQGTATMLIAMKSKRVRKRVAAIVAAGVAQEILNMMLSPEDDDGELVYDKIPEWDKARNIIIMTPWAGEDSFVRIPMPYGYNFFHVLGRNVAAYGRSLGGAGRQSLTDTVVNILTAGIDAFNPVGGTQSIYNFIAPTFADPVVDLLRNEDFAGRPIRPEQPPFGPPVPASSLYFAGVSPITREVTAWLNEVTGGSDFRSGLIDVNPEVLDYLFAQVFGSAGAFVQRAVDLPVKLIEGTAETYDVPLVRRVAGSVSDRADINTAYERIEEIEQLAAEIRGLREARQPQEAVARMREARALYRLRGLAQRTRDRLRDLRLRQRRVREMQGLSNEERRQRLDRLRAQEREVVTMFNKRYLEAVG